MGYKVTAENTNNGVGGGNAGEVKKKIRPKKSGRVFCNELQANPEVLCHKSITHTLIQPR